MVYNIKNTFITVTKWYSLKQTDGMLSKVKRMKKENILIASIIPN